MKTPMQKAASLAVELRQRINPAYSTQRGTESYERRECAEMIEALLFEIDRLTKQCNDYAQEAYKTRVEAETLEQHYKCKIDTLKAECFKLAAGQCLHDDGLTADDGGTPYCKIKLERDALNAAVVIATDSLNKIGAERDRLRTLITKLHAAKGRYHTQLACCDLFDAVGLKNERPVK